MILKITRDELLMEWGVYGGCLLCPLYPLLESTQQTSEVAVRKLEMLAATNARSK